LLCVSLENNLTHDQLVNWGWRFSFGIAGVVGLVGFVLRQKLHESAAFERLRASETLERNPLRESFKNYKKRMTGVLLVSLFEVVGLFMICFYLFQNSAKILKIDAAHMLPLSLFYLTFFCFIMPVIGKINNKYKTRDLLKISVFGAIIVSPLFYCAIAYEAT